MNTITWTEQKKARYFAIGWTIIYLILLLPLSNLAFLAFYFSGGLHADPMSLLTIALAICVPLSMLVSIIFMWIFYAQKKYAKSIFFALFPYGVILLALLVYSIIELTHFAKALL